MKTLFARLAGLGRRNRVLLTAGMAVLAAVVVTGSTLAMNPTHAWKVRHSLWGLATLADYPGCFRAGDVTHCGNVVIARVGFEGEDLGQVLFENTKLQSVSFKGANLRQVEFLGGACWTCDFTNADMSGPNTSPEYPCGLGFVLQYQVRLQDTKMGPAGVPVTAWCSENP